MLNKSNNVEKQFLKKLILLFTLLVIAFFISFFVGRYDIAPKTLLEIVFSKWLDIEPYWEGTLETVILDVRFPRIMLAILIGGALAVSGASYQTVFKNPMVSPDILGVSAGAGFGAALAMLHSASWVTIQLSAFLFGILAVILVNFISYIFARQEITVMILAGVVVSSLFQALLSIVKTLADTENALPSITFWLMGSLGRVSNNDVQLMIPTVIFSLVLLFLFRHKINALSAGEDEATTMGVNVPVVKLVVIITSTMLTVTAVSIAGIIGWVGMVVPHIARMITGASYSKLMVNSFLIGGLFLLIIDNIVRGIEGVELPIGVLTALIGTPIFVFFLSRVRRGWM